MNGGRINVLIFCSRCVLMRTRKRQEAGYEEIKAFGCALISRSGSSYCCCSCWHVSRIFCLCFGIGKLRSFVAFWLGDELEQGAAVVKRSGCLVEAALDCGLVKPAVADGVDGGASTVKAAFQAAVVLVEAEAGAIEEAVRDHLANHAPTGRVRELQVVVVAHEASGIIASELGEQAGVVQPGPVKKRLRNVITAGSGQPMQILTKVGSAFKAGALEVGVPIIGDGSFKSVVNSFALNKEPNVATSVEGRFLRRFGTLGRFGGLFLFATTGGLRFCVEAHGSILELRHK